MSCQDQDILDVNIGLNCDPSHSAIHAEKIEHGDPAGVKVEEHGTLDDCDEMYQKPDMINIDILRKIAEGLIKEEPGTFTSDTKSIPLALIKTEDCGESSEYELKYDNEEGTSNSINMENNLSGGDVAGPSSSYELKSEIVDLESVKMERDEDTTSESTEGENRESGKQYSADKTRRFKHMNTLGEEYEETFGCIKCGRKFSSKLSLDGHIVIRHSNNAKAMKTVTHKIHRCGYCKYVTVMKNQLNEHMRIHGDKIEGAFDCIKCEREFWSKNSLDSHIVTRHRSNDEMINNVTSTIHRCNHCKYITVRKHHLSRHIRMHGGKLEETFDCTKCKMKFSSKLSLDGHILALHSNDVNMMNSITCRIHRCRHCSYTTVYASCSAQHMRKHEKKIFYCVKCEKQFSSKHSLDNHVVTRHSNNDEMMINVTSNIHRCKHCKFVTVYASQLTQHMRKHGEKLGKTFHCIQCEKEFSSKYSLYNHIVTRHSSNDEMMNNVTSKIYRCEHCKYVTVYGAQLTQHMKKQHREKLEETKCETECS